MAKYSAESTFIASIYPGELDAISLNHGPKPEVNSPRRTTYKLKPVKRGEKPYVIEVSDAFENILDPTKSAAQGRKFWSSAIVPYREICDNLISVWAGNMVGVPTGAGFGIMEVPNTLPTQAQLRQMMDRQTAFAEWAFQEGEKCNRENNWKDIRDCWRVMAIWLGKKALWANPESASTLVNCPACRTLIDPEAAVCATCGTVVRALPESIAHLNQPKQGARV